MEQTAYLAGERENDAEFDDEPTRTPARSRPPLRPPNNLAGSGKKVVRVERFAHDDEDYLPYEDEDEGEDDELELGEQERVGAANTKRKMKGKAMAKVPAKERSNTKPAANSGGVEVDEAKKTKCIASCQGPGESCKGCRFNCTM
ncbi:hypothetical protein PHMEG_00032098 [Phytophthora megakarya]|uniref:Uncharacterized protein n=1 Tax=Phytophthora megakarya TaxID=4795 RepID=A0A225UVE0_9STRA|nr:hypothetical protein PHMEG_00032098 [Phytophthora megakarya]